MARAKSIDKLYLSLRGGLAHAVVGIVPPKEVEDIVQETYVRVCQIEKSDSIRTPQSYLFKTARNLALDYVKRSESRLADSLDENSDPWLTEAEGPADATFEQAASNEEFALFCDAVRHLPLQCRRAFVLRKVYGYSQREIAREMSVSENTVEKHIALGLKRCTYYMQQFDHEHPRTAQAGRSGKKRRATSARVPRS
jgi:RNA polymerase sigma factor (sigma-70 family)